MFKIIVVVAVESTCDDRTLSKFIVVAAADMGHSRTGEIPTQHDPALLPQRQRHRLRL